MLQNNLAVLHANNYTHTIPREFAGEHVGVNYTVNDSAYIEVEGKTVEIGTGEKSPDNPYELKSVSGNLVSAGRNLFDGVLRAGYWAHNISPTVFQSSGEVTSSNLIMVGGSLNCYLSKDGSNANVSNIRFFDKNKTFISEAYNRGAFTTPVNCAYVSFHGLNALFNGLFQLEFGSAATPYIPFKGISTATIPLISTGDKLIINNKLKKAWVYRDRERLTLNGSEIWRIQVEEYWVTLPHANIYPATNPFCTHFEYSETTPRPQYYFRKAAGNQNFLFRYDFGIGGVENFKLWLSENPITIEYPLANPYYEETPYEEIKTYYPYTQVYTTSEIQPTIHTEVRTWKI